MRRYTHSLLLFLLALCLFTSCYKLLSTHAPKQVTAGQTFEVSFTVVDDGSDVQNFVTDWSYAGVRVPNGWTVTVPTGAHQQFAEDWVYYSDGSQVSSKHDMQPCDLLTQFYNSACPRSGYTWHAFQTKKKVSKNISACWRNGCDSIRITFLVTVPKGTKLGKYSIDFIGGDEEDNAGVSKYATYTDAKGSRLFHVGTVNSDYVENRNTSLSCRVEVVEDEDAIHSVSAARRPGQTGTYTMDGRKLNPEAEKLPRGVYVIDGKKRFQP